MLRVIIAKQIQRTVLPTIGEVVYQQTTCNSICRSHCVRLLGYLSVCRDCPSLNDSENSARHSGVNSFVTDAIRTYSDMHNESEDVETPL
jgi:hypothetical protein